MPNKNTSGIVQAFGKLEPFPRFLAFFAIAQRRPRERKIPVLEVLGIERLNGSQGRFKRFERTLAVGHFMPVSPERQDGVEAFFAIGSVVFVGLVLALLDEFSDMMDHPARKRVVRRAELQLAYKFLAERENSARWFGNDHWL